MLVSFPQLIHRYVEYASIIERLPTLIRIDVLYLTVFDMYLALLMLQ